jgi:SAM-dependent methyltransferase
MPALSARLNRWLDSIYEAAAAENQRAIEQLLEPGSDQASLLDLGCDDGLLTRRWADRVGAASVDGVEIVEERARLAEERGIAVTRANLEMPLPFTDGKYDVVCSNQVIEHLRDTDRFVAEVFRILRPGGYAVISTENLASWHNIGSLLFGWQPFSLANVSHASGSIGNPLALHPGEPFEWRTWAHVRVFAYRGLSELFSVHGFSVEAIRGAGYFPLPARVGRADPRHAAFITVKARKH